jgi:peptidoglycan/LPS O-acetylase OafA/YrhL
MTTAAGSHIRALDGLRGGAALWVLIGHATILTGTKIPIISHPDLAVDLFMMLSGFLMCFHYMERHETEPWHQRSTWALFWTRRFFRIAPLYYTALLVALLAGPMLGHCREIIAEYVPGSMSELTQQRYYDQGIANVLIHASFIFGFSPTYSFRTALPDWSIGLEMAFYAAFPFLMILVSRFGFLLTAIAVSCLCMAASYLAYDFFGSFAVPAFLPIKLPVFLAGMLIAAALKAPRLQAWLLIGCAFGLILLPVHPVQHGLTQVGVRLLSAAVLAGTTNLLLIPNRFLLRRAAALTANLLGNRLGVILGDASYAVYLVHLLVMLPVAAIVHPILQGRNWLAFVAVAFLVIAIVYPIALLLNRAVERPGIDAGKKAASRLKRRTPVIPPATT